jgi:hypothetical protein
MDIKIIDDFFSYHDICKIKNFFSSFTQLNNSIRMADESSTKLPVTYLNPHHSNCLSKDTQSISSVSFSSLNNSIHIADESSTKLDEIDVNEKSYNNEAYISTLWKCQCLKELNTNLLIDRPFWRKDLNSEYFFSVELKNKIINKLQQKFCLERVYAVSQTYSHNGNYHIDSDSEKGYTFLLYINEHYDDSSDGYLYIKTPDKSIITIEPLFNRGILFPANLFHKGNGYNRYNSNLRICIAWKFELIEDII